MIYLLRIPRTVAMLAVLVGVMALVTSLFAINIGYYAMTSPSWRVALARAGRRVRGETARRVP